MRLKRAISGLLSALLLAGAMAAQAEQPSLVQAERAQPVVDTVGLQPDTQLVVGSPTQMNGLFSTDLWGNNTADMDVRALLHGYATAVWVRDKGVVLDSTVVQSLTADQGADGARTYTFTIAPGLMYNDGTPIDARDYLFSLLLCSAPEVAELGGNPRGLDFLVGYEAYKAGSGRLSGARLLNDHQFSLTVTKEYQPYFYGLALTSLSPYPISVITPGCELRDDGDGAYIAARQDAGALPGDLGYTPGVFSKKMLQATMLDPTNGYAFNPYVTSGPYELVSNDRNVHEASFRVNPNYMGNYEGQKPHIESLLFRQVKTAEIAEELSNGTVDLVNKVANGDALAETKALLDAGELAQMDYPRTGLTFLSFVCDRGPTASVAVRQAIARLVDKQALLAEIVGADRALPVHGYCGMGQWMMSYQIHNPNGDVTTGAEAMEAFATAYDLQAARQLLEGDGWTLNERGEPFVPGTDPVRYRMANGQMEPLTIRWAKSADNPAADIVEQALSNPFAELGIGLDITTMPFAMLLRQYYSPSQSSYDMFYMGSNFTYLFDPYYDYSTAPEHLGLLNTTRLKDDELMALAEDMRRTEPGNADLYMQRWLAFQARWVEQMPLVPLYSNTYADLYRPDLQNYSIAQHSSWALAIPYAYFSAPQGRNDT